MIQTNNDHGGPIVEEMFSNYPLMPFEQLNVSAPIGTGPQGPVGPQGPIGPPGQQGETGLQGPQGIDGYSPIITVAPITGGHEVTITDVDGSQSFDVMDGRDGGQKLTKTLTGNPATASDAIAATPTALAVGGVSTQDGTPTPEAPVAIESVDELTVLLAGANMRLPESGATVGKFLDADGNEVANASWRYTTYLPVVDGKVMVYSGYNQAIRTGVSSRSYWYDADKGKVGPQTIRYGTLVANGMYEWTLTAPSGAAYIRISIQGSSSLYQGTRTTIDLQGHQLRSLPDGTRDELTVDARGYVTLTQRIGVTTTATTDGITATVGTDAMSTTGGLEDGATVIYKLAMPVTIDLGTMELPANPAPDMTAWADGGSATPSLSLTYERDLGIVIANLEAAIADLATS